ncbi:MAG: ribonuclease HI [Lachnospiraceae bacterium]|nr:ribonuclease HI [Lachnospiraceae bacterium]
MYTDGASKGNPGVGGIGVVILYVDTKDIEHKKEIKKAYKEVTNNQMELTAVIEGLSSLKEGCEIDIYSDSKYVVEAFNEKWIDTWIKNDFRRGKKDEVKNIDLWTKLISLTEKHDITWHWVKGHDGNIYNERCDELANIAIKDMTKS